MPPIELERVALAHELDKALRACGRELGLVGARMRTGYDAHIIDSPPDFRTYKQKLIGTVKHMWICLTRLS